MDSTTCDKMVKKAGTSLALFLTEELKMLDVDVGDVVRVTIKKL